MPDFGVVALDSETRRFVVEMREFLDANLPAKPGGRAFVLSEDAPNPDVIALLASRGWIMPRWPVEAGGAGLDQLKARLLELELARRDASVPGGMRLAVGPVQRHGSAELKAEVLPLIPQGKAMVSLGYTEPDNGSDAAAAKTRAELVGDEWLINGQKIFTTSAHFADYCWLITRTNTSVPKHKGLTMFLIPMHLPGIDVRPLMTLGRGRSNVVYLSDVRVPDKYRVGPVDGGWVVAGTTLDEGHGVAIEEDEHLSPINGLGWVATTALERVLEVAVEWARHTRLPDGSRPKDNADVRRRLAQVALDIEVCWSTPGEMGRVVAADTLVRTVADVADLIGPASVLPAGADGAVADGVIEEAQRFAQASLTFGGTVEIFRNNIAQRHLGLPKPPPPAAKSPG
ncbi:MAG TPA: acyl-CoA dehydrogenase family protein [Candidatus Nitrosotalea sp.]|nr:acyl-CoA dehydrogenase family protein [Candidatus Nitrosotalea sp.]